MIGLIRCADKRFRSIIISLLLGMLVSASPSLAADLALVGGKIYPSPTEPPIDDGTILVHDERIYAVGPSSKVKPPRGATVLACKGTVVTAGFWNSHVHFLTKGLLNAERLPADRLSAQLEQMLTHWGFTTVFDVASVLDNTNAIRRRIASGEVRGPRIFTVGDPFYPKGGTPHYVQELLAANHIPSEEVQSATQAVARVRRQIDAGADGVKIFTGSLAGSGRILPMPMRIVKAIVTQAHHAGKPAFAHPSNIQGIEIALRNGVDVLAHTAPLSQHWPPDLINRMKAKRMALIPTLTLWEVEGRERGQSPEDIRTALDLAIEQLKDYSEAGGQILFGTDVGYTHHPNTAKEFALMSRAGLSFQQVLASLTTNPAQRFRCSRQSGRIAKGMQADLVVLKGDPAKAFAAFSRVRYTIRNGKVIYAAQ
ncbi:MAG: amidohydrolase family protein [Elusimicrobia bacterium]|nr:amidohydrolase family protein [Elusimicrobiota bacterium]